MKRIYPLFFLQLGGVALASCIGVVLATSSVYATPVIGFVERWDSGLATWTNSATGLGTGQTNLTNPDTWLRMTFPYDPLNPLSTTNDVMYSTSGSYTGNYVTAGVGLRFSYRSVFFLTDNTVRFRAGDGHIWDLTFNNSTTNTWQSQATVFSYGEGWTRTLAGQTEADFLADLAAIDAIGIYVRSVPGAGADQYYELDDWEYFLVPEPGTLCMLGGVLLSFGLAQRKRLRELYLCRQRA